MKELIDISKLASSEGYATQKGCYISIRQPKGMSITDGRELSDVTIKNIVTVGRDESVNKEYATHLAIYHAFANVKVILHLKPRYAMLASQLNITVRSSLELFAQVIGGKLNVTTSIPQRVVETLIKNKECLLLNGGLIVTGATLVEAYQRAELIERAIFTYMAVKAVDKRYSTRKMAKTKIYKLATERCNKHLEKLFDGCVGIDKLSDEIVTQDQDNDKIIFEVPIFSGIFAASNMTISGVSSIDYDSFDNKKHCRIVASNVNKERAIMLRGRGILVVDDDSALVRDRLDRIEMAAKFQYFEMVKRELAIEDVAELDIVRLFARRIGLKVEIN